MKKLLIAIQSISYASALADALEDDIKTVVLQEAEALETLLQSFQPDALVLEVVQPLTDCFLRAQLRSRPAAVILLSGCALPYIEHVVASLRADLVIPFPCSIDLAADQILSVMDQLQLPESNAALCHTLRRLGFKTGWDGYLYCCVGIPMFSRDTAQRLSKELYPEIGKRCGTPDPRQIEHAIRQAIQSARSRGETKLWQELFPAVEGKDSAYPSNKQFISRLAELFFN